MATWRVYAEVNGSPLYSTWETETEDEDFVFDEIVNEFRSTLQIDEDDD